MPKPTIIQSAAIIFDSEALSRLIAGDTHLRAVVDIAISNNRRIKIAAPTIVEATHRKTDLAALNWVLSRIDVVPIDQQLAVAAAKLLIAANKHGHQYAIDALVCAVALHQVGGMPTVYTLDPDDFDLLAGDSLEIIPLR